MIGRMSGIKRRMARGRLCALCPSAGGTKTVWDWHEGKNAQSQPKTQSAESKAGGLPRVRVLCYRLGRDTGWVKGQAQGSFPGAYWGDDRWTMLVGARPGRDGLRSRTILANSTPEGPLTCFTLPPARSCCFIHALPKIRPSPGRYGVLHYYMHSVSNNLTQSNVHLLLAYLSRLQLPCDPHVFFLL